MATNVYLLRQLGLINNTDSSANSAIFEEIDTNQSFVIQAYELAEKVRQEQIAALELAEKARQEQIAALELAELTPLRTKAEFISLIRSDSPELLTAEVLNQIDSLNLDNYYRHYDAFDTMIMADEVIPGTLNSENLQAILTNPETASSQFSQLMETAESGEEERPSLKS